MRGGGVENISHTNEFIGKYFPIKSCCVQISEKNGVGGYMKGVDSSGIEKNL